MFQRQSDSTYDLNQIERELEALQKRMQRDPPPRKPLGSPSLKSSSARSPSSTFSTQKSQIHSQISTSSTAKQLKKQF